MQPSWTCFKCLSGQKQLQSLERAQTVLSQIFSWWLKFGQQAHSAIMKDLSQWSRVLWHIKIKSLSDPDSEGWPSYASITFCHICCSKQQKKKKKKSFKYNLENWLLQRAKVAIPRTSSSLIWSNSFRSPPASQLWPQTAVSNKPTDSHSPAKVFCCQSLCQTIFFSRESCHQEGFLLVPNFFTHMLIFLLPLEKEFA